jgi:hypothetical protein
MATHGRDSLIAFDLYTQETAPGGKHDGSIIDTVRDRSNHGATETNCPDGVERLFAAAHESAVGRYC